MNREPTLTSNHDGTGLESIFNQMAGMRLNDDRMVLQRGVRQTEYRAPEVHPVGVERVPEGRRANARRPNKNAGGHNGRAARGRGPYHKRIYPKGYYENRPDGSCLIPLTLGYWAIVDADDAPHLASYSWQAIVHKDKGLVYAQRMYKDKAGKARASKMHRQILGLSDGKILVDHKNGNGIDNRKENLRTCTTFENARNAKPKNGRRFKGVRLCEATSRWHAYIGGGVNRIYLGTYSTEEAAAAAYNKAATHIYRDFARTNDVPSEALHK